MCGLPGSGKSTLSRALAERLGALRWDKDELRHLLFPPHAVQHDRALNDLCMELLHAAARHAFTLPSLGVPAVILDGRPFTEQQQRNRAREAAQQAGANIAFILCTAPMEILRQRIESSAHLAPDRNQALLEWLAATAEPFEGDEIVIDTGSLSLQQALARCLRELAARELISLP
ncbi:MAG: hypothetical protein A3I01_02405 [Betaproteobacteria bacterium RIFCSPLOWO2_02_FULL_65_24]|nr:MAG: hypothetical protein A3I01_02405 [Betaproteobacteria bacterium RIFCSPLOWO2_02_FULL_65_24]OGA94959.1 MAG: hypothetical protein A3G27_15740 [Betaproteobacteria bacterium RIFCSPLOWO2_12_FULL_66_14]